MDNIIIVYNPYLRCTLFFRSRVEIFSTADTIEVQKKERDVFKQKVGFEWDFEDLVLEKRTRKK